MCCCLPHSQQQVVPHQRPGVHSALFHGYAPVTSATMKLPATATTSNSNKNFQQQQQLPATTTATSSNNNNNSFHAFFLAFCFSNKPNVYFRFEFLNFFNYSNKIVVNLLIIYLFYIFKTILKAVILFVNFYL